MDGRKADGLTRYAAVSATPAWHSLVHLGRPLALDVVDWPDPCPTRLLRGSRRLRGAVDSDVDVSWPGGRCRGLQHCFFGSGCLPCCLTGQRPLSGWGLGLGPSYTVLYVNTWDWKAAEIS